VLARKWRSALAAERDVVMAMHPSHKRAREILERRHIAEAEHEAWRAQHDELELELAGSDTRLAELRARQTKRKDYTGELRYRTNEDALLPPPRQAELDDALGIDALK
jgi:hypothetical protein